MFESFHRCPVTLVIGSVTQSIDIAGHLFQPPFHIRHPFGVSDLRVFKLSHIVLYQYFVMLCIIFNRRDILAQFGEYC